MRKTKFWGPWSVVFCMCLLGMNAGAATHSPNDDVTTRSNATNYDEYDLGGGAYAGLLVKLGGSHSWLEFTLGDNTAGSAVLHVYNYWTQNDVNYEVRLKGAQYGFNETTLTGSNAPDTSAWTTVINSFHVDAAAKWYTLDVTGFYNAHLGQTVTFKLEAVSGSGDGPIFADREGTGGHTQYPYLEFTAGNLAPEIGEVVPDPDTARADMEYTRQLVLVQGTPPISWSVVSGPPGLSVGAAGAISGWIPGTADIGQTFGITIQAENDYGSDTESWQVVVSEMAPPEPVYPADDVTTRGDSTNYDEYDFGNGAYAGLLVKPTNSYAWIEFPLAGSSAATAVLHLYNYWTKNNVNYDIRVSAAPYNFNETTLTGSNVPNTAAWTTVVASFHVNAIAQWYALDVTDFYNAHLGQTVTFKLEAVSGSGDGPIFADREGTGGYAQHPYLEWTPDHVPPVIREVTPDPDTAYANLGYSRQLSLLQGTPPVTWSLLQGPDGLVVDASGRVSGWTPAPGDIGGSYIIEVQADNAFGADIESWQVVVEAVPPPIIQEVAPDPARAYVGSEYKQQLSLVQGAGITWSLVEGPAGLFVSGSGLVQGWTPDAEEAGQTYTITIQADNPGGSDTETWQVWVVASCEKVFPSAAWQSKTPAELGLDATKLNQVAANIGGVGCIARQGYLVKTWGDQASKGDWASAAKPVISTLLFFAVQEGRLDSVNDLIENWGWDLIAKDEPMTFAHLANMTSGYARGEAPGAAWAYNDYAIKLYAVTLFDRVFGTSPNAAATAGTRLGFLQFQDGSIFSSRDGYGLSTTPRDFARIGWLWCNRGYWNGTQLLAQHYFDTYMQSQVPASLPRTSSSGSDYLGIGTYGGGSDQTADGPGIYGFNWWFNDYGATNPSAVTWPDAPADTFAAIGHGGPETLCAIPSLDLVIAFRGTCSFAPGNAASSMNQNLKLLTQACPPCNANPPVAVMDAAPTFGQAPLEVHFDGSGSHDAEGPILAWEWDFEDDGTVDATGIEANYMYAAPGVYTARLVVTDTGGLTGEATVEITVTAAPTGSLVVDPLHPAWFAYESEGPFFMCGPGDPEDFLYRGTRNANGTRTGDQAALISKLAGTGANCIYMQIVRSHGGDGDADENPFEGGNINNTLDSDILGQWETWFTAMDTQGITIFLIFYDDSAAPFGRDLVSGELDTREAYLVDTIVNTFKHQKRLIWCVAEEYGEALSKAHVSKIAGRIKLRDDNHHPVAVHQNNGTSFDFNGDPNLDQFAVQYNTDSRTELHNAAVAAWNNTVGLKNINLAEFQPLPTGADLRQKVWAIAMGGAYSMLLYMDIASTSVSDLQTCGHLVGFMEATRFNETAPADALARGNTLYVLADPGEVYLAYGDSGVSLGLNMIAGAYDVKWFDTIDGDLVDSGRRTVGTGDQTFAKPAGIGAEAVLYLYAAPPPEAPTVTQQPLPVTVCPGHDAFFFVVAQGEGTLAYQWRKDEQDLVDDGRITGSQSASLQITPVEATDAGLYRCIVSNEGGDTPSNEVLLSLYCQEGEGEPAEGESEGEPIEGEGEPAEGEGELIEGEGEPVEGEGEIIEGEGEPAEGEDEGEVEGESEGELIEGEGEPVEGEGELIEGEGEPVEGEGELIEGEGEPIEGEQQPYHPADTNIDFRIVISEAIAYLAGWQQGSNPIAYAIRAAYIWQNGERYLYDGSIAPPLCWILAQ